MRTSLAVVVLAGVLTMLSACDPSSKQQVAPDGPAETPVAQAATAPATVPAEQSDDVKKLTEISATLREKYGVDRPWDDLADSPAIVRRHRGMVARALSLLAEGGRQLDPRQREKPQETLAKLAKQVLALEAGQDVYGQAADRFDVHYYSKADGSGQPFAMRVPTEYDPSKPFPLIVIAHGLGGRPAAKDFGRPTRDFFTIMVWGRGDLRWVGLAERDILDAIEYVRTWYSIDPSRIYIDGGSMGGRGTWVMTSRHPDLFAAGAPLFGWADGLPLENLRNVPIFVMHGGSDWTVSVDHSRYAVSRLLQLGYNVAHKEFPAAGHEIPVGEDFTGDWMLSLRQPTIPEAVTYTCQCEEQGKAYWLNVRKFTDPHQPASVQARLLGKGPYQAVALNTENIDVLELALSTMGLDVNQRLLVQVGLTHLEHKAPLPDKLYVVRGEKGFSLADTWKTSAGEVRSYQPGAAANLYTGEPLLIVYGTRNPQSETALRQCAQKLSAFGGHPLGERGESDMAVGRIPVKADSELTDLDMQRYNLILIGLPRDNAVTAKLMPKLPVRIDDQKTLVVDDRQPVSLEGAALRLFYYNPQAPQRLIFVLGTNEDGERAAQWYTRQPDRWITGAAGDNRNCQPDLVVQTFDQTLRRRMQFTHDWKWVAAEGADKPAPVELAGRRAFLTAVAETFRRAADADFGFEAGVPESRQMYDPKSFTLADLKMEYAGPQQVLAAEMTGEELNDVYARWISQNALTVSPAYQPTDIDPEKTYKIALSPALCWTLKNRQKNLTNVRAASDWLPQYLWKQAIK